MYLTKAVVITVGPHEAALGHSQPAPTVKLNSYSSFTPLKELAFYTGNI